MLTSSLVLGIDLGTTGLRIAIINTKKQILFTSSRRYSTGLEIWEDWIYCFKELIQEVPKDLKEKLVSCSIAGTSGTLLACKNDGVPLGKALPYFLSFSEYSKEINKLFSNKTPTLAISRKLGLKLVDSSNLIKRFFMRQAIGELGTLPRLLRGEEL